MYVTVAICLIAIACAYRSSNKLGIRKNSVTTKASYMDELASNLARPVEKKVLVGITTVSVIIDLFL